MKKFAMPIFTLSTAILFSCGAAPIASSSVENDSTAEASSEPEKPALTTFRLDASNGAWTLQSYTGKWSDNDSGLISSGKDFPMEGFYAIAGDNAYCSLKKERGVVRSKYDIDLKKLSIDFDSASPIELRLYSAYGASEYHSTELSSSLDLDVEGYAAFSIHAGSSDALINGIEITFSGEFEYTPRTIDEVEALEGDCYEAGDIYRDEYSYKAFNRSNGVDAIDTHSGECENFLVIPVELSDYPFSDSTLDDLDPLFNGSGPEDTYYWESLSSFYRKSSFGRFNPTFEIADKVELGMTASELASTPLGTYASSPSQIALRKAISKYREEHDDEKMKEFDGDGDGYIDGVILIYSCPDYTRSRAIARISTELYWAFCYWDYYAEPNPDSPSPCAYFWCSYDFNYEATRSPAVDSHTLIHEFGHMMGLDDYYSYDGDRIPAGAGIMMDSNIGDQDIFSKLALGWVDPYVVEGDSRIVLQPSFETGECIILAPDWNGTSFDEYLIFELYAPGGLNELDADRAYPGRAPLPQEPGVKIYHIDARAALYTGSAIYIEDPDNFILKNGQSVVIPASNSGSRRYGDAYEGGFDLIRMIEADKKNSFDLGPQYYATDEDLFHTGDTFSMEEFKDFFPKGTKFNLGMDLDYQVTFEEVSWEGATIVFEAI